MSFYLVVRQLRESGHSYESIYQTLREGNLKPLKGDVTRDKVKRACLSLQDRIKELRAQNKTLKQIAFTVSSEDYTTARGVPPTVGCVWYTLNRKIALQRKRRQRANR